MLNRYLCLIFFVAFIIDENNAIHLVHMKFNPSNLKTHGLKSHDRSPIKVDVIDHMANILAEKLNIIQKQYIKGLSKWDRRRLSYFMIKSFY